MMRYIKSVLRGAAWGLLLLAVLAAWRAQPAAAADGRVLVRTEPGSIGLRPGEQGTVTVWVENVGGLYGAEFHLRFDPNVVEVVDIDAAKSGVQVKPGDWFKDGFVASNHADNTSGAVDYAVTLLNPAPPLAGSGAIAMITFKAKGVGASALTIEKALLATRDAAEIKSETVDGAVGVSASGQAPQVQSTGPTAPVATAPQSSASNSQLLLAGAAGLGVAAFAGALIVVVVLIIRRRKAQ